VTEFKIFGQVKVRDRCYDVTENKQGEKSQENHRKKITGHKISDNFN
jgi:hypothetical protein